MVVTPSHIATLATKAKEAEAKKASLMVQESPASSRGESQVQLRSSL